MMGEGVTVIYLVEEERDISIGDAIETVVCVCMRKAQILSTWVETFESSGEEKQQNISIEMLLLNMDL